MSLSAAFLTTPADPHNDNHERLPALFENAGWQVDVLGHDELHWRDGDVFLGEHLSSRFDLIWPVGLGPKATFLDRIAVLTLLEQWRLINPASAYLHLHGKTAWLRHAPTTVVAHQPEILATAFAELGGAWVLKPAAGSYGAGVRQIGTAQAIHEHMAAFAPQYWLLQRYIPEIEQGELRTLICGEKVLGSYLRIPSADGRANLAAGGQPAPATVDGPAEALVGRIHAELIDAGVGFAAIDTVAGYLMEVNVANPGGLKTLGDVYGAAAGRAAQERLVGAVETRMAAVNAPNRPGKGSSP